MSSVTRKWKELTLGLEISTKLSSKVNIKLRQYTGKQLIDVTLVPHKLFYDGKAILVELEHSLIDRIVNRIN